MTARQLGGSKQPKTAMELMAGAVAPKMDNYQRVISYIVKSEKVETSSMVRATARL